MWRPFNACACAILTLIGCGSAKADDYISLFVIERSTNANVVYYEARVTPAGSLHASQPVVAYWRMFASDGRREDLNSIEKKRSYGFSWKWTVPAESLELTLVSQRSRPIRVAWSEGAPRAELRIGDCEAILRKIYVSTGKINIFHVNYIELFGTDRITGGPCKERVDP